jgi:hypothetical protein
MKNLIYIMSCLLIFGCDENTIMPAYEKVGSTTSTVAAIQVSNDEPAPGETVTITMMYVNPTSDPLTSVELKAKQGSGSYEVLEIYDENTGGKDVEINHELTYVAPAAGTEVTFDLVITSQKEYPQIMRASFEVAD